MEARRSRSLYTDAGHIVEFIKPKSSSEANCAKVGSRADVVAEPRSECHGRTLPNAEITDGKPG